MSVICARCGTQNPEGNQFCQACGSPLAVPAARPGIAGSSLPPPPGTAMSAAPPGPPPGSAPPVPTGYQSPYYAASAVGPQPMVHRTPWLLIVGAIAGLLLIMVGCGAVIAVLGNKSSNQTNTSGLLPSLPSPSPAGSPQPTQSPSGTPSPSSSPTSSAGTTASNTGESLTVPSGWTVASKDSQTITITNPNGDGSVTVGSGTSNPTQSAQQNKDTLDTFFTGKYPDTKSCPNSKTATGSLSGVSGIFWELCFTLSSGGQSIQAGSPLFAGANSDGSVYYVVILLTSQANMDSFINESAPILQSIQWKL
jgi:zinc-ribbon domain